MKTYKVSTINEVVEGDSEGANGTSGFKIIHISADRYYMKEQE